MKEHLLKCAEGWAHQAMYNCPAPEEALIWCMFYLWAAEQI